MQEPFLYCFQSLRSFACDPWSIFYIFVLKISTSFCKSISNSHGATTRYMDRLPSQGGRAGVLLEHTALRKLRRRSDSSRQATWRVDFPEPIFFLRVGAAENGRRHISRFGTIFDYFCAELSPRAIKDVQIVKVQSAAHDKIFKWNDSMSEW